ncbi:hypothetical protein BRADI_2g11055v3 [Brachypodium distachyon]|uniref:Uncharacterized protein n=1 Tax=Brachypodium distachyon TaxID=15368 RepID=A0A2K2D7Y3_BRADI|nr:hypothetical protein BRADI_2g11055v3 [Brachypodium distachyon]
MVGITSLPISLRRGGDVNAAVNRVKSHDFFGGLREVAVETADARQGRRLSFIGHLRRGELTGDRRSTGWALAANVP